MKADRRTERMDNGGEREREWREERAEGISEKTILQIIQSKLQPRLIVSTILGNWCACPTNDALLRLPPPVSPVCNFESTTVFATAYNDGLPFVETASRAANRDKKRRGKIGSPFPA